MLTKPINHAQTSPNVVSEGHSISTCNEAIHTMASITFPLLILFCTSCSRGWGKCTSFPEEQLNKIERIPYCIRQQTVHPLSLL